MTDLGVEQPPTDEFATATQERAALAGDVIDDAARQGSSKSLVLDAPSPLPIEPPIASGPFNRPPESALERWIYTLLAAAFVLLFFLGNMCYWVPAHPGVDQNGYLVGGRMLAENLTMRLSPVKPGTSEFDPHQFVGRMWVGADFNTPAERYYPKYPLGLPALVATSLWIGGSTWGPIIAYGINPVAMALAVWATFLLVRLVAGSFWALCAAVVLASSPVTMGLTTNPNSHATAVCCVAWGMYFLLRWWQAHGVWRALFAGLLLGYAATIRYTEGLLILPLSMVVILGMRWRQWRAYLEAFWALAGWAIPVGVLVAYNYVAMGHITGYDGTNESLGFSWQFASDNWETVIRQLGTIALYCIFPFSVIGLLAMLWRNWRLGLVLAAWTIPCILVYTFYYWAPDNVAAQIQQGSFIGYMRFFLTILPALVMVAFWLFDQICRAISRIPFAPRWALPLAQTSLGLVTLIAVAVHLQSSTFAAEVDQNTRLMLQANAERVLATAPAGSVIFAQDNGLLHHLQFERDYLLYTPDTFNKWYINRLPDMDPDEPQGLEPARRDALYERLKDLSQAQLDEQQRKIMSMALDAGRRVFFVIPRRDNDPPPLRTGKLNSSDIREFRKQFPGGEVVRRFATPDRFELNIASAWMTPIVRPAQPNALKPRKRRIQIRVDRRQTLWEMVEVTKKPPEAPAPPPAKPANKQGRGVKR